MAWTPHARPRRGCRRIDHPAVMQLDKSVVASPLASPRRHPPLLVLPRSPPARSQLDREDTRAAARSASYAAATALHTRREHANMRAAVIVAQELLRCRLLESDSEALLEWVAELLEAACRGAAQFCTLPMS